MEFTFLRRDITEKKRIVTKTSLACDLTHKKGEFALSFWGGTPNPGAQVRDMGHVFVYLGETPTSVGTKWPH